MSKMDTTDSLRISSDTLTSTEIQAILGTEGTRCFDKGEKMSARNPSSMKRDCSLWILNSDLPKGSSIDEHLGQLADFIHSHLPQFEILKLQCTFDFYCGLFFLERIGQGGVTIPAPLLAKLMKIPPDIAVNVYYPSTE